MNPRSILVVLITFLAACAGVTQASTPGEETSAPEASGFLSCWIDTTTSMISTCVTIEEGQILLASLELRPGGNWIQRHIERHEALWFVVKCGSDEDIAEEIDEEELRDRGYDPVALRAFVKAHPLRMAFPTRNDHLFIMCKTDLGPKSEDGSLAIMAACWDKAGSKETFTLALIPPK